MPNNGAHQGTCCGDIVCVQGRFGGGESASSAVYHRVDVRERVGQSLPPVERRGRGRYGSLLERFCVAGGSHQRTNPHSAFDKLVYEAASQESGRSGNKYVHGGALQNTDARTRR
jgi:hypothetical protein